MHLYLSSFDPFRFSYNLAVRVFGGVRDRIFGVRQRVNEVAGGIFQARVERLDPPRSLSENVTSLTSEKREQPSEVKKNETSSHEPIISPSTANKKTSRLKKRPVEETLLKTAISRAASKQGKLPPQQTKAVNLQVTETPLPQKKEKRSPVKASPMADISNAREFALFSSSNGRIAVTIHRDGPGYSPLQTFFPESCQLLSSQTYFRSVEPSQLKNRLSLFEKLLLLDKKGYTLCRKSEEIVRSGRRHFLMMARVSLGDNEEFNREQIESVKLLWSKLRAPSEFSEKLAKERVLFSGFGDEACFLPYVVEKGHLMMVNRYGYLEPFESQFSLLFTNHIKALRGSRALYFGQ